MHVQSQIMSYVLDGNNGEFIVTLYVKMNMIHSDNGFKRSRDFGSKPKKVFDVFWGFLGGFVCLFVLLLLLFWLFSIYKANMVEMV